MNHLFDVGYRKSRVYDYSLLKIKTEPNTKFKVLQIGYWSLDVNEGDIVYSCGYPLGLKQRFISQGLLSTKWTDTINLKVLKVIASVPIGEIKIPRIPKFDGAVTVTGESMYPLIKSGDYVLFKIITDQPSSILFRNMCIISFEIEEMSM